MLLLSRFEAYVLPTQNCYAHETPKENQERET